VTPDVDEFFAQFEAAGATAEAESVGPLFAPYFLSADPSGTTPVPREALLAALPHRAGMFAAVGLGPARLTGAEQTDLDDAYVLVKTSWAMDPLEPGSGAGLELRSTFVLRREDGRLTVVFYLNHQDVAALLRART
jgi:hypothetical protein